MSGPRVGVVTLNFGEPAEATLDAVVPFLERIFLENRGLEAGEDGRARARELAEARAPGLIEEYREIGGSPLNAQADAQAEALERELRSRHREARVYSAFQFTGPFPEEQVARAVADGVDTLVALPVYPLCGRSTTVAALNAVRRAVAEHADAPVFRGVAGWHAHPSYTRMRADHIRAFLASRDVDLQNPDTLLHFSVHGTPLQYLDEGNRYDRYVEEHCRALAERLGVADYGVGFQNHTHRRIPWTQPDNEDRLRAAGERNVVVVPLAFMHEQSETLAELDDELREFVEGLGKIFLRVPVPHDHPDFPGILADLVEGAVEAGGARDACGGQPGADLGATGRARVTARVAPEAPIALSPCRCARDGAVFCTNGARDLPPSPYATVARTA